MTGDGPRERMVEAASRQFARHGHGATTMRAVVAEAGAPWGSLSHYLPGGKDELSVAAVEFGGARVRAAIAQCVEQTRSPGAAVAAYLHLVGQVLADSDYTEGCPVSTVALEVGTGPVAEACVVVFASWQSDWAAAFRRAGVPRRRADTLAASVVTNVSGALLLGRVTRSTAPLTQAARLLSPLVDAARSA